MDQLGWRPKYPYLKEIAGHDHNYYSISDQVNRAAWAFLKSKRLAP